MSNKKNKKKSGMKVVEPTFQPKLCQPYIEPRFQPNVYQPYIQPALQHPILNEITYQSFVQPNYLMFRAYYIHQFKIFYALLLNNHKIFIQLNNQIYITKELIYSGKLEYNTILIEQEIWYKIQYNIVNHLMNNIWKFIDTMDKSYFPDVNFQYDPSFKNIITLFELIYTLMNKI